MSEMFDAGSAVASLKFDLSDLQAGFTQAKRVYTDIQQSIKQTEKQTDSAKATIAKLTREIELNGNKTKEAAARYDTLWGSLSKVNQAQKEQIINLSKQADAMRQNAIQTQKANQQNQEFISNLKNIGGDFAVRAAQGVLDLGKAALDASIDFESMRAGLIAVSGSAEEADRQLKQLRETAKTPGLGFEEAVKGAIRLQAAGIDFKTTTGLLEGFGNALASVGKGKNELDLVTLALSQIGAKGKLLGQDLRQIQEQVPQIQGLLKSAFNTSDLETIQKAGITSKEFFENISKALAMLPKANNTLKNQITNASDAMKDSLRAVGDSIKPIVGQILQDLVPALQLVKKTADGFRDKNLRQEVINAAIGGKSYTGPLDNRQQDRILKEERERRVKNVRGYTDTPVDDVLGNMFRFSTMSGNLPDREIGLIDSARAGLAYANQSERLNQAAGAGIAAPISIDAKKRAELTRKAELAIRQMSEAQNSEDLERLRGAALEAIAKAPEMNQEELTQKLNERYAQRGRALARKSAKKKTPSGPDLPTLAQGIATDFMRRAGQVDKSLAGILDRGDRGRIAAAGRSWERLLDAQKDVIAQTYEKGARDYAEIDDNTLADMIANGAVTPDQAIAAIEIKQKRFEKLTNEWVRYQSMKDSIRDMERRRMSDANTSLGYDRPQAVGRPHMTYSGEMPVAVDGPSTEAFGPAGPQTEDEVKYLKNKGKSDYGKQFADGLASGLSKARISLQSFTAFYKSTMGSIIKATQEAVAKIIAIWATARIGKQLGAYGGPVGELLGSIGGAVFGGIFRSQQVSIPEFSMPSGGTRAVNINFHGPVSMDSQRGIEQTARQLALHLSREQRFRS